MRNRNTAWKYILIVMIVGFMALNNTRASDDDKKAVMEATDQFYIALNSMFKGDLHLMKDVWSHADDVTYMGPGGGIKVGWDQVLTSWETQAAMKLGGSVHAEDMRVTASNEIAVSINYSKGENIDAEGKPRPVSIRATNIFRKEDGKWKMIGHHTDLLPFLQK